jgi:molecular chaperone DnaJ
MASQAIHSCWNRLGKTRMARNYYLILGVGCDATPDEIKSAYRREAKRLHPDHSGEGSEPFLAVQEAYEVLGDPGRRQAYDEELAREQKRAQHAASGARTEPLQRRRCPIEPLIPTQRSTGSSAPFQESSFPSPFEELFRRPDSDWDAPIRPRTGRRGVGEIHVQVALTREQALHGGRIRVWLPGQARCPACHGWGRIGFFECPHCTGSGTVVDEFPVDIAFRGGLVDGSEAGVSLGRLGMGDLVLVLHFTVNG